MVKDKLVFLRGYYRLGSIKADKLVIVGGIESTKKIIANTIFVRGYIKARYIKSRLFFLVNTSYSSILDIRSSIVRIIRRNGRTSIYSLAADKVYLEYTHVRELNVRRAYLSENTFIEYIVFPGELLVFLSPYVVFKINPSNLFNKIVFKYSIF